jgi:glucose dehydrogenase
MTIRGGTFKPLGFAVSVASAIFGLCGSASAAETTYQRLLNARAEPQNWLMRMGSYGNWNHSALTQIDKTNVANLKVKFMAALSDPNRPSKGNQYFTPLVEDGFMYVATSTSNTGNSTSGTNGQNWSGNSMRKCRVAGKACTASRCSATTCTSIPVGTAPTRG